MAVSARVRADEKVGQMACGHHGSAQAFFQIGFGPQLLLEIVGNIFISTIRANKDFNLNPMFKCNVTLLIV